MDSPVHDAQAERAVLATMLAYNNYYDGMAEEITEDLFYEPQNKGLLQAFRELRAEGREVDNVAILEYSFTHTGVILPKPAELAEYFQFNSVALFKQHITRLQNLAKRRSYARLGSQLLIAASDEAFSEDEVMATIDDIKMRSERKTTVPMSEVLKEFRNYIAENRTEAASNNIYTGFRIIDELFGFHPSDLVVVGAESSQGKTSFVLTLAANIAAQNIPVAIYSMEMDAVQVTARMLSPRIKISSRKLLYAPLTDDEYKTAFDESFNMEHMPIYFDYNSVHSYQQILASVRGAVRRFGVRVVMVDYMQMLSSDKNFNSSEEKFAAMARAFKNIAKELKIVMIVLSQFNRGLNGSHYPSRDRLRASGQIYDASDFVLYIYRPGVFGLPYEDYPAVDTSTTAELIIDKGRNTGGGKTIIGFDAQTTHFYDLDGMPIPQAATNPVNPFSDGNPFRATHG